MAGANACIQSEYFSGQGTLLLGARDAAGQPLGLRPVGNVSSLSLAVETEVFEHKESCTGARGIDLVVVQEVNATLTATLECLNKENLALALFGSQSTVAAGSVVDQAHVAFHDLWTPLPHVDITSLVITDVGGVTTYVDGVDYVCDLDNGAFRVLSSGSITDLQDLEVDYSYGAQENVQALTTSAGQVLYGRFHGLNTAPGLAARWTANFFRMQVQPLAELQFINDELAEIEIELQLQSDPLQTTTSKFFEIIKSQVV